MQDYYIDHTSKSKKSLTPKLKYLSPRQALLNMRRCIRFGDLYGYQRHKKIYNALMRLSDRGAL